MKDLDKRRKEIRNQLSKRARWYDIKNKTGDVAEIRIYDEISFWGITAEDFVNELDEITAKEIVVAINCPGGDVFDGIAIYNALRSHPAKVTTRVDSLAASAASIIVQAGDQRVMTSSSQLMIHEAWGLTIGTAQDMREMADLLDRQSETLAGIYARHGSEDRDHYRALMQKETWFSDEEAVEEGLADEVVDPSSKANAVTKVAPANKTLNDEISEAMDVVSDTVKSAERVAALRAEKGKKLSETNVVGLDELKRSMEELKSLLNSSDDGRRPEGEPEGDGRHLEEPEDELLRIKTQLDALRV